MKAIRIHEYGDPDVLVLEDVPDPRPAGDEVLIQVEAIGVNPADLLFRSGALEQIAPRPRPYVPGMDVAGIVTAIGHGVTGVAVGDRVFGLMTVGSGGTYAEQVTGLASWFAHVPEGMDMVTAASLPTPGTTAIQLIEDGVDVHLGQHVLVTGATGACGVIACYVAQRRGATVTAGVRGAYVDDVQHADHVLVLDGDEPVPAAAFDAVADTVGGATARGLLGTLKPGGPLVTISTTPVEPPEHSDVDVRVIGVRVDTDRLAQLAREVVGGRFTPTTPVTMALAEAAEAHRLAAVSGAPKIVLVP